MRLGGFVIYGNGADGLDRCVHSLASVCDQVVAIRCGSDGGPDLRAGGVRAIARRWEGYGAARAAAVPALQDCDYLFFLDTDEWLDPDAVAQLRAWKTSEPTAPQYTLARRDWADLDGHRFLYRVERHVRLVRRGAASWDRSMIVHEALPRAPAKRLAMAFDHAFATSVEAMRQKSERYALLWALRFQGTVRRFKWPPLQRAFHVVRELLLKGALFRGGADAIPLALAVAHHHARKYELLAEIRRGAHAELASAYNAGRLAELFARLA